MDKISRLYTKKPILKISNSSLRIQRNKSSQPLKSPADRILFLQRTIGNQAVQRLIKSGTLQAKLKIGQPGEVYEQEADRVADAVMRMPEPGVQRQVEPEEEEEETLQSKSLANQITPLVQIQRQEEPEEEEETLQAKPLAEEITPLVQKRVEPEEEEEELQVKATLGHLSEVTPNLEYHIHSLKGGGRHLAESERAYFEPRFGQDFSQVRIHTDAKAAESARTLSAKAFTLGRDIVFGAGQYAPGASEGRRLMAHELTHVVQQKGYISKQQMPILVPVQDLYDEEEVETIVHQEISSHQREEGHQTPIIARANIQSTIARKSQEPPPADKDIKLRSWMDPFKNVASIYFTTKSYIPDTNDKVVIKSLAEAYQYTAKQNRGLKGAVIGHADIRPSQNPDNTTLSQDRAFWVARSLTKYLMQLTGIEAGYFDLEIRGEGVAECRNDPECESKADLDALAAYRRADIFIYSVKVAKPKPEPKPPAPPKLSENPHDFDSWLPDIRKGDKRKIMYLARTILEATSSMNFLSDVLSYEQLFSGELPQRKPAWWDSRANQIPDFNKFPELVKKALLLHRDYKELDYWCEKVSGVYGSYARYGENRTKENLEILMKEAGYFQFIFYSVLDLGKEVHKLSEK